MGVNLMGNARRWIQGTIVQNKGGRNRSAASHIPHHYNTTVLSYGRLSFDVQQALAPESTCSCMLDHAPENIMYLSILGCDALRAVGCLSKG